MESPVLLLFQVGAPPIGYGTPGTVPVPMQTVRREDVGFLHNWTRLELETNGNQFSDDIWMIFGCYCIAFECSDVFLSI